MAQIIRESFYIPKKTPEDIYFSIKVWMMSNNAYIDEDSTLQNPRLTLYAKQSGGLRFLSRPPKDGILTITWDEQEDGTIMEVTIESLMNPDFFATDETIKGTLFSRLDSLMEFLKTPINSELYRKYYSDKFIQNQLGEIRLLFILFSILTVVIYFIFKSMTTIGALLNFFLLVPIILFGLALLKSQRYWSKRRYN